MDAAPRKLPGLTGLLFKVSFFLSFTWLAVLLLPLPKTPKLMLLIVLTACLTVLAIPAWAARAAGRLEWHLPYLLTITPFTHFLAFLAEGRSPALLPLSAWLFVLLAVARRYLLAGADEERLVER